MLRLAGRRVGAMRDVELYRAILGLTPPWTVVSVELDVTGQRVVVQVDAGGGPFACPECGTAGPRYDRRARRGRHLDTMQFTTWIEADRRESSVRPTGCARSAFHGRSPARSSPPCSSGWPSTCCENAR